MNNLLTPDHLGLKIIFECDDQRSSDQNFIINKEIIYIKVYW